MNYLSVCSGIEAATCAWHGLGWAPLGFSEIDAFPSAVLAHHYPHIRNYGDMTRCDEWEIGQRVDLLVGGTPCQSFSVAGKRGGIDDGRGHLAIKFFDLVRKFRPTWIVWENVPGVFSSNKGRDFGLFLSSMAECGYGFAYRTLNSLHHGVPQHRRRVFVVGHRGGWRQAAAALFETSSFKELERHHVAGPLDHLPVVAFAQNQRDELREMPYIGAVAASVSIKQTSHIRQGLSIRKVTVRESERLQGFPDDYTRIPYRGRPAERCPDTLRYKAIGNSMAVPVMRWIGRRIAMCQKILEKSP